MRSVLISTDFVIREDGTLTPLEINTNTKFDIGLKSDPNATGDFFLNTFEGYFEHVEFDTFLKNKNITKIITIDSQGGSYVAFKLFAKHYGYEFEEIIVAGNSVTIPDVPDDDSTLIIRIAYDTYALLDDVYARDMYEFHNLIKNESFASPVTFRPYDSEVLDTIQNFNPSIDGKAPNYVLKARTPAYDLSEYPKVYRFDTIEELNLLKESITSNEFLQKYEFNSNYLTEDKRTTFFRSMDLVYGPNLDVINVINYQSGNSVSTENDLLRYETEIKPNKELDILYASKYYPNYLSRFSLGYHFDETDNVLLPDNSLRLANDLKINDSIKSIYFNDDLAGFDPVPVSSLQNFDIKPSTIKGLNVHSKPGIFINITVSNPEYGEYSFYDGVTNFYVIQKAGTDMAQYIGGDGGDLEVGDNIFVYDKLKNLMVPLKVESIYYDVKTLNTYVVTLEPYSEFFIELDTNLFLLQHNACNTSCGITFNCPSTRCTDCSKNAPNCPYCAPGGTQIVVTCIKI